MTGGVQTDVSATDYERRPDALKKSHKTDQEIILTRHGVKYRLTFKIDDDNQYQIKQTSRSYYLSLLSVHGYVRRIKR